MSIKLLPASVNVVDASLAPGGSTSLVPVTQRAITTGAGQISLVTSADAFAWSSSTRQGQAKFIHGTPVEDPQSDETEHSGGEYLSGSVWGHSVESSAVAQYLSYGAGPTRWSGRLIDLYA